MSCVCECVCAFSEVFPCIYAAPCVRATPAASIAESIQMSGIEILLSLLMINLQRSPAELLTAAFVTEQEAYKATWELRAANSH